MMSTSEFTLLFGYSNGGLYHKCDGLRHKRGDRAGFSYLLKGTRYVNVNGKQMPEGRVIRAICRGAFTGRLHWLDGDKYNNHIDNLATTEELHRYRLSKVWPEPVERIEPRASIVIPPRSSVFDDIYKKDDISDGQRRPTLPKKSQLTNHQDNTQ